MKPTLAREIVLDALMMAVWRRKPLNKVLVIQTKGLNTTATTGDDFVSPQPRTQYEPRGNCWENAVAESFLAV